MLVIWEYLYVCVFTKLFTGTQVSEDFQFWVSGSRNNRKYTALECYSCIYGEAFAKDYDKWFI